MAEFQLDLGIWGWFWSILQLPWPTYYIVFNSYTICCYSCILESLNKVQVVCIKNEFRLRTSNQQNSLVDAKAWFWDSVRSSTMHINNIYWKLGLFNKSWQNPHNPILMAIFPTMHGSTAPNVLPRWTWCPLVTRHEDLLVIGADASKQKKRQLVDQGLGTIEVYGTNETRVCEPWSLRMIVRTLF